MRDYYVLDTKLDAIWGGGDREYRKFNYPFFFQMALSSFIFVLFHVINPTNREQTDYENA